MDFGKIKYKLNMGEYKCDSDVLEDCSLVFDNCNTYNTSDAPVYKYVRWIRVLRHRNITRNNFRCGVRLLKYFVKRCNELGFEFPDDLMGEDVDDGDNDDDDGPTKPKRARNQ